MAPIVRVSDDQLNYSDQEFHPSDEDIPNCVSQGDEAAADSSNNSEDEVVSDSPNNSEDEADSDSPNNSDDEDGPGGGYQLLPQDPEGNVTNNNHLQLNEPNNAVTPGSVYISASFQEAMNTPILDEGLAEESLLVEPINMDDEHVAKIKEVMSNISLPTSAIPGWANSIPEDKWKTDLIANIQERKK